MSSLRQFLERIRAEGSARRRVRRFTERVRGRTASDLDQRDQRDQRDERDERDRATATPGRSRNRYIDPRTEDREHDDDTRWMSDRDRIRVEYSPHADGDPDPGEVVWTWIPYVEDPAKGKDRPAIIIGRTGEDLVGVPLTTKPRRRETNVKIGTGKWDSRGRVSFACIDRVMVIDPDAVRREGAVLKRRHFDAVVDAVDQRFDIVRVNGSM